MKTDPRKGPRVFSLVWNLIRGGTEGQCARVAMGLAERGLCHRLGIFRREGFFLAAAEERCGPAFPFEIRGRFHPTTPWLILKLASFLRRKKIDILHAWDMDACLFGATAARLAGCRLVTSRRDLGQIYPAWKLNRLTRVERQAAAVVVNARAIATVACKAGVPENKIRLLPNLLDVAEFDRLSQESSPLPPPPSGVKRVVMVARLDPEKDPALLVRAAVALMAERSDFEVVIAGDGPERPALNQLVGSAGDRIRFLGDVKAVPALLRTCQIGLLVPKSNEGLSNTLLEYMAAGLPMIATDCGGNRELVRPNETGILIPTGDQAALVGALRILLDDSERGIRLGAQARRDVAQLHDRGPVLDAFESLYREVANVGA